jgi:hypothetical protein
MLAEAVPKFRGPPLSPPRLKTPAISPAADPPNMYWYQSRMDHYLERHTYDGFDFGDIKLRNTMWPEGTTPKNISDWLQETLHALHRPPAGRPTAFPPGSAPPPLTLPNGIEVRVMFDLPPGGGATRVGSFHPTGGRPDVVTFTKAEMKAIAKFFGF